MGNHAVSYCVPRLNKVIKGEQGGISRSVEWYGGGGFHFYKLGPAIFDSSGHIRQDIRFPVLAAHIWFSETALPWHGTYLDSKATSNSPFLGIHDGHAYVLLYNGILGDKRPGGGNVLTHATLTLVREQITTAYPGFVRGNPDYPLTVYGEQSRLMSGTLDRERITFKQTPYDIKVRK